MPETSHELDEPNGKSKPIIRSAHGQQRALSRCQPSDELSFLAGKGIGYHYSTQIILPKNKKKKAQAA